MAHKDRRSKILKIRLTESEFHGFQKTAERSDLPMSDLARSMLCGVAPQLERRRRFVFHPVDPALVRQVAAIGNNLNQLLGWAHTNPDKLPPGAVIARLVAIERALSDLTADHTHEVPPDAH